MDAVDHRSEPRFGGREHKPAPAIFHHQVEILGALEPRLSDSGGWSLVEVLLTGGAPWGFTLRGGREHQEPLIITKVEECSKAAAVKLQVGDEIVSINDVPLSGYRQEAICLVKGSHKTLSLVVRRRSEPLGRPHSWHSTKFTESQTEVVKASPTPTPVWHTRYDTSSQELSKCWDQSNLRRVSDQFSSLGSMDSLEHSPRSYQSGRLSPAKSSGSIEHLGVGGGAGCKRDSAYSSYSTGSGTPDDSLSRSNAASTENVLHKVGQWDPAANRAVRSSQSFPEGARPDQGRDSPRAEEQPGSRSSNSSRSSFGPVWHVPERKKVVAPSPPPPPPPVRSDSFAVTKVHERGLVTPYSEAAFAQSLQAPQGKGAERTPIAAADYAHRRPQPCEPPDYAHRGTQPCEPPNYAHRGPQPCEAPDYAYRGPCLSDRGMESMHSYNPAVKPDIAHPLAAPHAYTSSSHANSQKACSFSSSDVHLGQPAFAYAPRHQRQYSDESTFYPQARVASVPRQQNVAGYYSSMQELSSASSGPPSRQIQPSASNMAIDRLPDAGGHSRYYCVTARQPGPSASQTSLLAGWKADDMSQNAVGGRDSASSQKSRTVPPRQEGHPDGLESNGHYRQEGRQHPASAVRNDPVEDRGVPERNNGHLSESHDVSYLPSRFGEQLAFGVPQQRESPTELRVRTEDTEMCSQSTPMLHSLSQERAQLANRAMEAGLHEALDPGTGKQERRSDRYATTLRNEIQMKRAQLQKSRSVAALSGTSEADEDAAAETWKADSSAPSTHSSSSSTYKDNLKEVQARVLRATSFRRRDLEPMVLEQASGDAAPGPSDVFQSRPSSGQVLRIGHRKRFPAEKKVRSFSEPDKINEVGVEEDLSPQDSVGSFADRRKFFEVSGRPSFPSPFPKHSQPPCIASSPEEVGLSGHPHPKESAESQAVGQTQLEQQRLGTFAEYEATWKMQRKGPEARSSGRYHSADNILDPGVEERTKGPYVHERSRSSPSADLYGQDITALGRKSAEHLPPDHQLGTEEGRVSRLSDGESKECPAAGCDHPEDRDHELHPSPHQLPAQDIEPPPTSRRKGPQRPPPPKLDRHRQPNPVSSSSDSQETLAGTQGGQVPPPGPTLSPPPGPTHLSGSSPFPGRDSLQAARSESDPGAAQQAVASQAELPPPPPAANSSSSSCQPASLLQPSMEEPRSLSPQFSPQRLTDRPPVSIEDGAPSRIENTDTMEGSHTAGKKVPVKIVHSESSADKWNRQYLVASQPSATPTPGGRVPSEPSCSLFCAYSRQKEPFASPSHSGLPQEAPPNGIPPAPAVAAGCSEEDKKREELTRDIVGRDRSLADILDQRKMKTTMDLMEGIFPQGEQILEGSQQRRVGAPKQMARRSTEDRHDEDSLAAASLVTSSSYYNISAPKAELLIKMKDMQEQDSEDELDVDLANKKHELINSLSRKLQVLREARESVQEDVQANNALGEEVELLVQHACKPNEFDKFRMFVGDLDKVVSLLLSLSGRLARVENALNSLEEGASADEKRTLVEKQKLLIRQHSDAKELKENLDRRERVVYDILASYLSEEHLADYQHFVKMKSALIIEQRKLEDKIKLGEEQLKCLTDSLPLDQRLPFSGP